MMREIKFRGLTDNGWVHGHLTGFEDSVYIQVAKTRDDGGNVGHIENYLEQVEVDPGTIGQYIGKKDINGIEIYDGDKVRWTSGKHFWEAAIEPCRSHPEGQLYAIETINNLSVDEDTDIYTYEVTNSREGSRTEIAFLCRTIEVIGNIYETIKEGKE